MVGALVSAARAGVIVVVHVIFSKLVSGQGECDCGWRRRDGISAGTPPRTARATTGVLSPSGRMHERGEGASQRWCEKLKELNATWKQGGTLLTVGWMLFLGAMWSTDSPQQSPVWRIGDRVVPKETIRQKTCLVSCLFRTSKKEPFCFDLYLPTTNEKFDRFMLDCTHKIVGGGGTAKTRRLVLSLSTICPYNMQNSLNVKHPAPTKI